MTVWRRQMHVGAPLLIPPVAPHLIWPPWPDHSVNVTARNTVHHGLKSRLTIPVHHQPLSDNAVE